MRIVALLGLAGLASILSFANTVMAQDYKYSAVTTVYVHRSLEQNLRYDQARCAVVVPQSVQCRIPLEDRGASALGDPQSVSVEFDDAAQDPEESRLFRSDLVKLQGKSLVITIFGDHDTTSAMERLLFIADPNDDRANVGAFAATLTRLAILPSDLNVGANDNVVQIQKSLAPAMFAVLDRNLRKLKERSAIKITARWQTSIDPSVTAKALNDFCHDPVTTPSICGILKQEK